jgi:HrpA-like RNA helicase
MRIHTQTHLQTKIYLQAKELFEDRFHRPARLLLMEDTLTPPKFLEEGIQQLYEEGALTENTDDGLVTSFGQFAVEMPCELHLSKLVMYGFLFQCLNECIVMSAGLASFSTGDLFWYPASYIVGSTYKLVTNLSKSLHTRTRYDRGCYSEPMMYLSLYKDWLKAAGSRDWDNKEWCCERNIYPSKMINFNLEVCACACMCVCVCVCIYIYIYIYILGSM